MKVNWIEENIYSKFDKLGCMYVSEPDVHNPDYEKIDRIYRRNDISYGISTDTVVVYLYDKDFNIILDYDYAVDHDWICPTCQHSEYNGEYFLLPVTTTIDSLSQNLDKWLEEHYASSEPSS